MKATFIHDGGTLHCRLKWAKGMGRIKLHLTSYVLLWSLLGSCSGDVIPRGRKPASETSHIEKIYEAAASLTPSEIINSCRVLGGRHYESVVNASICEDKFESILQSFISDFRNEKISQEILPTRVRQMAISPYW